MHYKVKKALVIGGHVQGLGIIRLLGKMGLQVSLIDKTGINIGRHSKYCETFYEIKNEMLVNYLLSEIGLKRHRGSVIFPTNDEHVEYLSRHIVQLKRYYKTAVDKWEIVKLCLNKRKTYAIAKNAGIAIPDTTFPKNLEDVMEIAPDLSYPCIIKPAVMYRFYNNFKKKVFICQNEKELIVNYQNALVKIPKEEIIIQSIITGGSENQYSVGCLYNRDQALVTIVARRRRQHPIDFGNATTYAETVKEPQLVEFAYKLLNKIGYKGICEVEFKKDPLDGQFKFLEINPRTWKWHSIAETAKTPFIEKYLQLLNGIEPQADNSWDEASWSHYITDIPTTLKMILKGMYTKPEIKNSKQAVFDIQDLKPAIFEIVYILYLIRSR